MSVVLGGFDVDAMFTRITRDFAPPPVKEINTEALRETLEYLTAHPDEHNQRIWAAQLPGSDLIQGCAAYHGARLTGHTIAWETSPTGTRYGSYTSDGTHIYDVAQAAFGFTRDQAWRFFSSGASLDDLWSLAEEFTRGAVTRPAA